MKTIYDTCQENGNKYRFCLFPVFFLIAFTISSCIKYDDFVPQGMNAGLNLSTENTSFVLTQKGALSTTAITFRWTTGSNGGSNTSITYKLQVDLAENDFNAPLVYDIDKANYTKTLTVKALNDTLLNFWNIEPYTETQLISRIIAYINTDPVTTDTSNTVTVYVTPYKPVVEKLYMVGDATPNGWDISNATEMTPDENEPTVFTYEGPMYAGHFKLPVNRNTDWGQDMYMRNPDTSDSTEMYLHIGGESDDNQWEIFRSGLYKIEVSLCDLSIEITPMEDVEFSEMYMIGDATPIGWDIANAIKMTQDEANPYLFRYTGMLYVGDFQFPVNRNTDLTQDVFMRDPSDADSIKVYRHTGGAGDDNKWHIYQEGYYVVALDLKNLTISYERIGQLYIVGSATAAGWTISDAIELTGGSTSYEFIFTGALTAGDFKFPVNRSTSWTQHMFMKDPADETRIYFHLGGAGDDSKWTLTSAQAGNYVITVNLKDLTIEMKKQ